MVTKIVIASSFLWHKNGDKKNVEKYIQHVFFIHTGL